MQKFRDSKPDGAQKWALMFVEFTTSILGLKDDCNELYMHLTFLLKNFLKTSEPLKTVNLIRIYKQSNTDDLEIYEAVFRSAVLSEVV